MPKRHACLRGHDHPCADALLQAPKVTACDRLEHADLRGGWRHGQCLQYSHRVVAQLGRAGQHGVAHRRRDLMGSGCEDLGDEERVAAGRAVELSASTPCGCANDATASGDRRARSTRCTPGLLLALRARCAGDGRPRARRHDRSPRRARRTGRRRRPSSLRTSSVASSAQCRSSSTSTVGDAVSTSCASADSTSCGRPPRWTSSPSSPPTVCGDIDERSQVTWREQRLACAPQDPGGGLLGVAEATHDRGLANAGLASQQHQLSTAAAGDRGQRSPEHLELGRPFE